MELRWDGATEVLNTDLNADDESDGLSTYVLSACDNAKLSRKVGNQIQQNFDNPSRVETEAMAE